VTALPTNPRFHDLTNKRFGKRLILSYEGKDHCGNALWAYRCDCGRTGITHGTRLIDSTSCGCERGRWQYDSLAFENAEDTEHKAYWVGYMMADGCVTNYGIRRHLKKVVLTVSDKDGEHLLKFKSFLKSQHKLVKLSDTGRYPSKYACRFLAIGSNELAASLERYGVVPQKSLTARVRVLEYNRHFWRGCIDGDGWVSMPGGKATIGLCGSQNIVEQFGTFVTATTGAPPHRIRYQGRSTKCFRITYTGKRAVIIIKLLYGDCQIALSRKHAMANHVILSRGA